LNYTRL